MKQFPFVAAIPASLFDGTPLVENGAQKMITHLYFLLSRVKDGAFVGSKQGLDALTFAVTAKLELEAQAKMAEERGFWLLEDDRAEALVRATREPKEPYNQAIAHCLLPFAVASSKLVEREEK